MAHSEFYWIVEKRVLLRRLSGEYDPEVMRRELGEFERFLQEGVAPIYLVTDLTGLNMSGNGSGMLFRRISRDTAQMIEPLSKKYMVTWVILITSNVFVRFTGKLISHMLGNQFRPVASLAEACEVIRRIEPTLAPQINLTFLPYRMQAD